jgi:hypothetical protein
MSITLTVPKSASSLKDPTVLIVYGPARPGSYYSFEGEFQNGRELAPGSVTFTLDHPGLMYQVRTQDNEAIIFLNKEGTQYTLVAKAEASRIIRNKFKLPDTPREWHAMASFAFPASRWADEVEDAD